MKKIELIQTTIIMVAILAGYSALQSLMSILSMIAFSKDLNYMLENISGTIISYLLFAVFYGIGAVILIKKYKVIASSLMDKEDENPGFINIDAKVIIFILLIGIGPYFLIQSVPHAISDLFFYFKKSLKSYGDSIIDSKKDVLAVDLLRDVIGFIIIYASPSIANFINSNIAPKINT